MKRSIEESKHEDEPMDEEEVQVDFDFFNLGDEDYLSIKHLLRQLFDVDNTKVNLAELADFIINKGVGSTIKTDGQESDPFAVFALCEFDHPLLTELAKYYIERTNDAGCPELNRTLRKLFKTPMEHRVGFLFSERLLNMPDEIFPPLYNLLVQELEEANIEYDYVVIPSRGYTEHESKLDGEAQPKRKTREQPEVFFYHVEDELMRDVALASGSFPFETPLDQTDSKRAFQEMGIKPRGYLTVLKYKNLKKVPTLI